MTSLWETPFIVVDVETSGSSPKANRIIEIGCAVVCGGEVIREYQSLVNPHQPIQPYIMKMTGINYEMALNAPELEEALSPLEEIMNMNKAVFVAHNVAFDWSFIASSFELLGKQAPPLPHLCTIRLARRLINKNQKKNLGSLSQYYNVRIKNRHRAFGDALATALTLIEMLEQVEDEHGITTTEELMKFQYRPIKQFKPPTLIHRKLEPTLAKLPDSPGVYYFLDKNGTVIYVGKAKSLTNRVRSYFQADAVNSKKIASIFKRIDSIRWELTETELGALLLESAEIKRCKPQFNYLDKHYRSLPFLKLTTNEFFPRLVPAVEIIDDGAEYYGPFRSMSLIEEIINTADRKFKLRKCEREISENSEGKPCFYYHIERCLSPCSGSADQCEYASEIEKIRNFLSGADTGIIAQLEKKMNSFAEQLQFERASAVKNQIIELKKLFAGNFKTAVSIRNYDLALVLPGSAREKTVEVFVISAGRLALQAVFGRKAPLDTLFDVIKKEFYSSKPVNMNYSQDEINSLRIINSWLHRKSDTALYFFPSGKNYEELTSEIEYAIRNIEFESETTEQEAIN
jgi:DNA polymerase-3 subunit epsilon